MIKALILVVAAACLQHVSAHTYHLSSCPVVEPVPSFDMKKFLGTWFVIQKTSTSSRCLTYNYTESTDNPGEYLIEQVSEHPVLGVASIDNMYHYTGSLKVPLREVPARMVVNFPLSVAGKASYIVFMTDYESYAGVFSCQNLPAAHRLSVSILSRSPSLEKMVLDKIRNRISNFGISPYDLSIIDHHKCPKTTKISLDINPDTFSPSNIASGIRKAGEKLGDGFEVAANGAKKVYDSVNKDKLEDLS